MYYQSNTYLERLHSMRKGGAEEHDLSLLGMETKQLLNSRREFRREKFVRFVHNKSCTFVKFDDLLSC